MIIRILLVCLLFLSACSRALADAPPSAARDENRELAKAEAGITSYQSLNEWAGTFLFKNYEREDKGQMKLLATDRVRFMSLGPKWRIEQELLGEDGKAKSLTIEVFDGQRNWIYQERRGGSIKAGMINTRKNDSEPSRDPTHPDLCIPAQEVRATVMGGPSRKNVVLNYYAGQPTGAPKDTKAFVGLGRDGWPGWTAMFLDPARQYAPVEIWGGVTGVSGVNKTVFSSWRTDENGRLYAGQMVEEIHSPPERFEVMFSVTVEEFHRKVDPKLVENIAFPKGTPVMIDMDSTSRHTVGEEKH
jgi:hypothetical protein